MNYEEENLDNMNNEDYYLEEEPHLEEDALNEDEYEEIPGFGGMDDNSSLNESVPYTRNKTRDSYESADKNYHKLSRLVNGKKVNIVVYTSPICPRTCIKDAITGTRYRDYLVGSINEHQFFKVKFATGEMGQDSGSCFFDSPEQYEKHMHTTVSIESKNAWADKCAAVRKISDQ
jgi:hypothetical protein